MTNILIRHGSGSWHEPARRGYTDEAHLRDLIAGHPSLIPGVSDDVRVCIEFKSGAGPADVVAVDSENGLTLVECKMASNPQVRREIVGQVLDYASSFWRVSVHEFDDRWRARTGESLFADSQQSATLRSRLEENLATGEFRIILAVDEINDELRRIVEYLNNITVTSVAVIAVSYSRSEDQCVEVLIPNVYGAELVRAKIENSQKTREPWTPEQFLEWVDEKDPKSSITARVFIDALAENGCYIGRGSASTPSLNIGVEVSGDRHRWPIALYTYASGTSIELRFADFKSTPDVAERYLRAAESVPGVITNGEEIRELNYSKLPKVYLGNVTEATVKALAEAICKALIRN